MPTFETRWFKRYAKQERITDKSLRDAVDRAEKGLIDADLGGGLMKQRVARPGEGKSGGYRVFIAYREQDRAVFLYGFPKNERENIDPDELKELRILGRGWLNASPEKIAEAIKDGGLTEIKSDNKKKA